MGLQVITQRTGGKPINFKIRTHFGGKNQNANNKEGEQRVLEHFGTFLWKDTEENTISHEQEASSPVCW